MPNELLRKGGHLVTPSFVDTQRLPSCRPNRLTRGRERGNRILTDRRYFTALSGELVASDV
jgi:hypothetical protein